MVGSPTVSPRVVLLLSTEGNDGWSCDRPVGANRGGTTTGNATPALCRHAGRHRPRPRSVPARAER